VPRCGLHDFLSLPQAGIGYESQSDLTSPVQPSTSTSQLATTNVLRSGWSTIWHHNEAQSLSELVQAYVASKSFRFLIAKTVSLPANADTTVQDEGVIVQLCRHWPCPTQRYRSYSSNALVSNTPKKSSLDSRNSHKHAYRIHQLGFPK
jgi:hypothetical protein